ncbi:MAG: hypothetical protein H7315_22835 [Herminiimonas sp.]|nr:hypothetical protein [Herminiimonas sp.]
MSKEPAKGDRSTRLTDENNRTSEEKGHIAREISYLRDEQVNFSMVRDERSRQNRRQERLIRQQLVGLAETLDMKGVP